MSDSIRIRITGAADIERRLDPAALRRRVADAMDVVIGDAASLLSEASPVGVYAHMQGAWLQTTGTEITTTGVLGFADPTPTAPHAWFVINGRKPGKMPPIADIMPWVAKKLGASGTALRSVAFLVARKIGRKGTKPNDFVTPIVKENQRTWSDILTKAAMPPEGAS